MLRLFEVSGFKNFNTIIQFDFSDVRPYQHNLQCLSNNLISKAIVIGKAATGKTNLGLAIFDIVSNLFCKLVIPNLYDYYQNVDSLNTYAEFHYVFQFDSGTVDYQYRKSRDRTLIYEKLILDDTVMYEYDYQNGRGSLIEIEKVIPTINSIVQKKEYILKYILNNIDFNEFHPLKCMMDFVCNMLWLSGFNENRHIGYTTETSDYFNFVFDSTVLDEFNMFLHCVGIKNKLIIVPEADEKNRLCFDAEHPLPFFCVASSGLKALYNLYYWYKTDRDVSLLFIDDFDALYHYNIAESIIAVLKKMQGTQIILTSHSTNLLSNQILRPDCYFILTADKLTSFANATERELREGHNLEKMYLSGEFGG